MAVVYSRSRIHVAGCVLTSTHVYRYRLDFDQNTYTMYFVYFVKKIRVVLFCDEV